MLEYQKKANRNLSNDLSEYFDLGQNNHCTLAVCEIAHPPCLKQQFLQ